MIHRTAQSTYVAPRPAFVSGFYDDVDGVFKLEWKTVDGTYGRVIADARTKRTIPKLFPQRSAN